MFVFVCAGCDAVLTAPLSQVELPDHAHQQYGNGIRSMPVLMESGTFAVEQEPWGPPWRRWEEFTQEEAEARGVYAPVWALSDALPGAVLMAPGDTRGTVLIPERAGGGGCCGLGGDEGPNTACQECGLPVATRIDDCSLWQTLWLAPEAVRRVPAGPAPEPLSWEEVVAERKFAPPTDELLDRWSPAWEPAIGAALAHLLVASEGRPVDVPGGLVASVFQRTLEGLLPPGEPGVPGRTPKKAVLAGPGLPAPDDTADIALVPRHPQTGETWRPPSGRPNALVPLAAAVWLYLAFESLAFEKEWLPVPATGGLPAGVLRDDPAPPTHSKWLFRPDMAAFIRTLSRLPEVRSPWLSEVYGELTSFGGRYRGLF